MTGSQQRPEDRGIVVVGASLAGMNAAQVVRRSGYEGPLTVVGDESELPYDRPPLSKEFLTGELDVERLTLAPARKADELNIDIRTGWRATGLDLDGAVLQIVGDSGASGKAKVDEVGYDGLIIATGARARQLPGSVIDGGPEGGPHGIDGLFTLRSLSDARRLKAALAPRPGPVVVCGAGFIGGEVAASARTLGRDVVLLEAADAPLARVLDAEAGMATAELHRGHGVDVRLSTAVTAVHHDAERVTGVTLSDGSQVDTDVVIVGIGAMPNTEWLAGSGLTIDNGVVVDEYCRASAKVVAAGDVARFPNNRFGGEMMRIEQWDNAVEMARFAANTLLVDMDLNDNELNPFEPVPWFWSDQYDRKIQLAGIRSDDAVMAQGSFADQMFVRLYHEGKNLCGVLAWNRPRQAIIGRQMIDSGASLAEALERLSG